MNLGQASINIIQTPVNLGKLSEMSLTTFRGQFEAFLMVDNIDFVRFVCFHFFFLFGIILILLGPFRDIFFWSGWNLRSFVGFKLIIFIFFWLFDVFFFFGGSLSAFLSSIGLFLGLRWGPKPFFGLNSYRQITCFLQDFLFSDFLIFCFLGSFWGFWGPIRLF